VRYGVMQSRELELVSLASRKKYSMTTWKYQDDFGHIGII